MKKYILVVDDNKIECLRLAALLESYNYLAVVCEDGMSALEASQKYQFDAALIDIQMPVMDGFSFLQSLKKIEGQAKLPIIMMTASRHESKHILEAVKLGASDFVIKPLDPDILKAKLDLLIAKSGKQTFSERLINPADFKTQGLLSQECSLYSISEMGLSVLSKAPMKVHSTVNFSCSLFIDNEIDSVTLRVVESLAQEDKFVVHLTFLGLPEPKLKKIRQLVNKVSLKKNFEKVV